jgi:multiple sugar transport system ATP-binding protein
MRAEIKHLQATLGTTMVYVTHDQVEAMAMADTIVVMDEGVVQQIGTPGDLYGCPANLFVAGFIGEPPMNILAGKLRREDGVLEFQSNGFRLPLAEPGHVRVLDSYGKEDIVLGVRPRHIDPFFEPKPRSVPAPLFGFEPHGEYNILSFKIGDEVVLVQSGPGFYPEAGQTIHLGFTNNLHFFDVETGKSLLYGQGAN